MLPAILNAATLADHDLEPESTFESLAFTDLDLTGRRAEAVEFGQCQFKATALAGSQLKRLRLTDCTVETSDWSNARIEGGATDRIAFTGSRLTGLQWTDGLLRDATFRDCKLDLSNWRYTHFDAVVFEGCNLASADFTSAELGGASFIRCSLTRAQFSSASMQGARFRQCELGGIAGVTSWTGAVVHRDDLLELSQALAGALGILIEGDDA